MMLFCDDTKYYSMLVVIRLLSAVSPAWYLLYLVFSFSCLRISCWCCSRKFVCSVDFSDADIVDAPSTEDLGRTGAVTVYIGATHVWLLWTIS